MGAKVNSVTKNLDKVKSLIQLLPLHEQVYTHLSLARSLSLSFSPRLAFSILRTQLILGVYLTSLPLFFPTCLFHLPSCLIFICSLFHLPSCLDIFISNLFASGCLFVPLISEEATTLNLFTTRDSITRRFKGFPLEARAISYPLSYNTLKPTMSTMSQKCVYHDSCIWLLLRRVQV